MSLQSKFLTLSIKRQICITIIILTIFSIIVILSLICAFSYEILKEDYKQKKLYFFNKYKEYVESCFYYQNFCLLQYEEIIKRMQSQICNFLQTSFTYSYSSINFNPINDDVIETVSMQESEKNLTKKTNSDNYDILFFYCYFSYFSFCYMIQYFISTIYEKLSSIIMTHDIEKSFNIPGYNIPILTSPLIVSVKNSAIFSFNASRIYESIFNIFGSTQIDAQKIGEYYDEKINNILNYMYKMLMLYFSGQIFLFEHMLGKVFNEILKSENIPKINFNDKNSVMEFAKITSGYYSSINYATNKFSLISSLNGDYYYFETTIIDNFLYFINNRLYLDLDISFIPLYSENNTIISPELCIIFILKQCRYQIDKDEINKIYNLIKKGESTIKDCFIDKENIFNNQLEINDIFDLNFYIFLSINNVVNQGVIRRGKYPLYYLKYSYPNYSVLKEFKSDYLLSDQIDYYMFSNFKEPIEFSDLVLQNCKNCFFMIMIIVLYGWILCFCINLLIYSRVVKQLTEPIKKLQEAIETSSIKDENIFKYEYDYTINELFLTCKELLTGQIDKNNNDNGLGQFNISSISKDKIKDIDNNKYQKNLIINNNIVNQLMSQQQNMNDFSKNIRVNEELENNNIFKKTKKNKRNNSNILQDNLIGFISLDNNKKENLSDIKQNENNNNIKQNINNEERERQIFKKLFQISEYFLYYRNKVESNYISLNNNTSKDQSFKSTNQNINESLNINSKIRKTFIRGDTYGKIDNKENNISINMMSNKSLTYLWFMEAKKKKNKSLNYNIGNNYDELFEDYIPYQDNDE